MTIAKALLLFILPVLVLLAGGRILERLGDGRAPPRTGPIDNCIFQEMQKDLQLNMRLCGYSVADVEKQWGGSAGEREAEQRFLRYDLAFPPIYGGTLLVALLLAWNASARPFARRWLIAPVVLGMLADWTENLIHLDQLARYMRDGPGSLQAGWIRVASGSTSLKLLLLGASFLLLASLCALLIRRAMRARA